MREPAVFRIFPDQRERYTQAAQQLVDKLSEEELAYLIALKVKSTDLAPIQNSSPAFRIIRNQFENHPIEEKEESATTFPHLLWNAATKKSSKIKLTTKPANNQVPTKRDPVPLSRDISVFNIVPNEISEYILNLSNTGNVINLTRTGRYTYRLFKSTDRAKKALLDFNILLGDAAVGRWDKVFAAVTACPDLLLVTGTTKYCGRYEYSGLTIYQVGLKNYENTESYHEKMLALFEQCTNGKAEMAKQYFEVFPDEKTHHPEWNKETAKRLLSKLIKALKKDKTIVKYNLNHKYNLEKMSAELRVTYQNFWEYINKTLGTGVERLVCNPDFFACIIEMGCGNGYYGNFLPWQFSFYNSMVWDKYLEKQPTGILRALCQGLFYLIDLKEPPRHNGCLLRDGHQVLPLNSDPNFAFEKNYINIHSGQSILATTISRRDNFVDHFSGLRTPKAEDHKKIYEAMTKLRSPVYQKQ
jgi:hypothetical protein